MRFRTLILASALAGTTTTWCSDKVDSGRQESPWSKSNEQVTTMNIRIRIDGKAINATLEDNETSRDFISLLPLTLTLKDYAATEKISDLPKKLSTKGAPTGCDPSAGDITYYAPWGNLALFHKDFGYSVGLVKLGAIEGGVEVLRQPGPLKAEFERIKD